MASPVRVTVPVGNVLPVVLEIKLLMFALSKESVVCWMALVAAWFKSDLTASLKTALLFVNDMPSDIFFTTAEVVLAVLFSICDTKLSATP